MKTLVMNKLKSSSGESIAETLVSVLIAAFALLMLAGTINTASNLITKSQDTLKQYYTANNKLERGEEGPSTTTKNVTITGDDGRLSGNSYLATVYQNDVLGSGTVNAYDIQVTSKSTP